jgi:peptidoglycan hydrolase-like protein with peptidoglycan-binding domain
MFLYRGSQGSLVKALQEKLSQFGYDVGSVDGVFGPRTEAAVLKFQQNRGLDADGVVGPRLKRGGNTWSTHSWGVAIDLNAPWNAFGQSNFEMTKEFAQCFKDVGFVWGGDWSYPDAMHFQYATVR